VWVAEHRDTAEARGLAVWGGMHVMVMVGAIDLARTGQGNAYGLGFGPQEVGQWRVLTVLAAGDPELAFRRATGSLRAAALPSPGVTSRWSGDLALIEQSEGHRP
jgi:hypothetical protein